MEIEVGIGDAFSRIPVRDMASGKIIGIASMDRWGAIQIFIREEGDVRTIKEDMRNGLIKGWMLGFYGIVPVQEEEEHD